MLADDLKKNCTGQSVEGHEESAEKTERVRASLSCQGESARGPPAMIGIPQKSAWWWEDYGCWTGG